MPNIRPISDLRNKFAEISNMVHESSEPIYLTKNGYDDMVVMSVETYNQKLFENEIFIKLKEAEFEAKFSNRRLSHEEVFLDLRSLLDQKTDSDDV